MSDIETGSLEEKDISIDDSETKFPEGTVILMGDPTPELTIEEMQQRIASIKTTQELVDAFATVSNKFIFVEDETYDYEEGTEEYAKACAVCDAWVEMLDKLEEQVMKTAAEEGLLNTQPDIGTIAQLEEFMGKYGYIDGNGWWLREEDCREI